MPDEIKIEILEDGTISMKTTAVSDVNHFSADELLKGIVELSGGEHRIEKNKDAKAHVHHTHGLHAHQH